MEAVKKGFFEVFDYEDLRYALMDVIIPPEVWDGGYVVYRNKNAKLVAVYKSGKLRNLSMTPGGWEVLLEDILEGTNIEIVGFKKLRALFELELAVYMLLEGC